MPRAATRSRKPTTPATPTDPLADLRAPEDADASLPGTDELDEVVKPRPTASQDFHDEARAEIVAAFHGDAVATGMLHKGGTCGCRYLARLALQTALGAPQDPVEAEDDPEDPEGENDG